MVSKDVFKLFIPFACFFCATLSTRLVSRVAVVFNDVKLTGHFNSTLLKDSFERIPSVISKANNSVDFVYVDLNSRVCNYRKFLSLFTLGTAPQFSLVVLIDSCSCEKILRLFVYLLDVKFISSCGEPVLTVTGTAAVLLHTKRIRKNFLVVPQNAHGLEFHEKLFCHLLLKKNPEIYKTVWLSKKDDLTNQELLKVFRNLNHNVTHNRTTGATFIIAFKEIKNVKNIINIARIELRETFDKIVWIFPQLNNHLEIGSLFSTNVNAQVLTFKDILTPISCKAGYTVCSDQAARDIVAKTTDFLKRNWDNKDKYGGLPKSGVAESCSLSNAELEIFQQNSIDILKMQRHDLFGETNWKRISTWNGRTLQQYSDGTYQAPLGPPQVTVIRVPIVEYFPFVIKHEFINDTHLYAGGCSYDSRVCYGLKRQDRQDNNGFTINHEERFCCSGLTIDVITYLSDHTPYSFELYFQEEQLFGVYDKDNGTWNGVLADILIGKGDLAIDLSLTPQRCIAFGCSQGYIWDGFNTLTKVSNENTAEKKDSFPSLVGNFQLFVSPFHPLLFITVLMFFNVFLFLIWGVEKICLYHRNKWTRRSDEFTLLESVSYVWATAFGRDVGDSKKPLTLTARWLSSWMAFLALIFTNVYVARLMVGLVAEKPAPAFRSLEDSKVVNNQFKIGVVTGSSMEAYFHNTRNQILQQSYGNNIKHHLMSTLDAGIKAVKNGTLHGFIADSLSLLTVVHYDSTCSLTLLGKDFSTLPIGFVFRRDWPWAKEFKLTELEMNERNRSQKFLERRFKFLPCVSSEGHSSLSVQDISGLFLILTLGIAYCIFSLFMENTFSFLAYWYRNSSTKWDVPKDEGIAAERERAKSTHE